MSTAGLTEAVGGLAEAVGGLMQLTYAAKGLSPQWAGESFQVEVPSKQGGSA